MTPTGFPRRADGFCFGIAFFLFTACRPAVAPLAQSGSFRDASNALWLESVLESPIDKQVVLILRNRSTESWEHCRIDIDLPSGGRFVGTAAGRFGPGARAPVSGPITARPPSGFLEDLFGTPRSSSIAAFCVRMERWPVVSVSYAVTEKLETGLVLRGTLRNDSTGSAELPVVEGIVHHPEGRLAGYGQGYSSRGRFLPGQGSVLALEVDVFPEAQEWFHGPAAGRYGAEVFVSMEPAATSVD